MIIEKRVTPLLYDCAITRIEEVVVAAPSFFDKGMRSLSQAFGNMVWDFDYRHASLRVEEKLFESNKDAINFLSSLDPGKVCLVFGEREPIENLLALAASRAARLGRSVLFQSDSSSSSNIAEIILKEEYGVPMVPRWDAALRLNETERQGIVRAIEEFKNLDFELNVVSGKDLSEDIVELESCLHMRFENIMEKDGICFVSTLRDFMSSKKGGTCLEYASLDEAIFSLSSLAKTYGFSLVMGAYMELGGPGFGEEFSSGVAKRFYMDAEPRLVDEVVKIRMSKQWGDDGYITHLSLCE